MTWHSNAKGPLSGGPFDVCEPACKPDSVTGDSLTCENGSFLRSDLGKHLSNVSTGFYGFLRTPAEYPRNGTSPNSPDSMEGMDDYFSRVRTTTTIPTTTPATMADADWIRASAKRWGSR